MSLNVPEWSQEDVCRWIDLVKFSKYAGQFMDMRVDGDLLLLMSEGQLKDDIGINSKIERNRFTRELKKLKQSTDYSSKDPTNLKSVLQSIGPELTEYTYSMLKAGVDSESIRSISEDQLADECGVTNRIHRTRILNSMVNIMFSPPLDTVDFQTQSSTSDVKKLDVFICYERNNFYTRSAKLASLLRAHLEFKRYSVCLGSPCPASDYYDDDMLLSIKQAKNFLLVLTDESLHECIGDDDGKNWMHKEIVCAIKHDCNIIPVMENFTWPSTETLPMDMRDVPGFNGVRWVHDYKYACVDKIEKFMLGSVRCTISELRSAPNSPLMLRSSTSRVSEQSAYNSNNRLTVKSVDGSSLAQKTSDKINRRLSISLNELNETISELNLPEQESTQIDDAMTAENISKVPENATDPKNIVVSPYIPSMPLSILKTLFINKFWRKFRSKTM